MRLYCGIDLHSNNSYLVVLDEEQRFGVRHKETLKAKSTLHRIGEPQEIAAAAVFLAADEGEARRLARDLLDEGVCIDAVATSATGEAETDPLRRRSRILDLRLSGKPGPISL